MCGRCKIAQPVTSFRLRDDKRTGCKYRAFWCVACERIQSHEYYVKNREQSKEKARQHSITYRTGRRIAERKKRWRVKISVLKAYSKDQSKPSCVCCGESQILFLTLDHINNDGAEHRKLLGKSTAKLFGLLKRGGYPPGFQTLCWNCNLGKSFNEGQCPHNGLSEDKSELLSQQVV